MDLSSLDQAALQQTLPEDVIWKLITGKLLKVSPENLENLSNSSQFFRNQLARQRTTYLFEKVFLILISTVWNKEDAEGLAVSDVLNCRGVCSKSKSVVDKQIVENVQYFGDDSDENSLAVAEMIPEDFSEIIRHDFNDNSDVIKFLNHFERTHASGPSHKRSPFIVGVLSVRTPTSEQDQDSQRFLHNIFALFSKYGSYIHEILIDIREEQFLENAGRFRAWMLLMPNLKTLKIYSSSGWDINYNLERNQFPKLKYLESLETNYLPVQFFNQIIWQNNHISKMVFGTVESNYDFCTFPLPNLKNLEINQCDDNIIEKLGHSQVQWPLEKLKFIYYVYDDYEDGCADLFQVIQDKFAQTLVFMDLGIEMEICGDLDGMTYRDCKSFRLYLPNLKKIRIDMGKAPLCLDFLLPMKNNLEEIIVSVGYKLPFYRLTEKVSENIVEFMGFEDNMLRSNIWVLFKSLKSFEMCSTRNDDLRLSKSRGYTRAEWMEKNGKE